jgi:hypothetical protein
VTDCATFIAAKVNKMVAEQALDCSFSLTQSLALDAAVTAVEDLGG